jgi:hypothetical protein
MHWCCNGAGDSSRADSMPWRRLEHSSDERTERGTAALVARMDHHVVSDILVFIVRVVVFQDNKRVVTSRVPLMNGSHQSYIGRRCGIM